MDPLSLLCNLHAEGPATLRRLHRLGYHTIERIVGLPLEELAEVLHGPPSLARRFARQGEALLTRAGTVPLEELEDEERTEYVIPVTRATPVAPQPALRPGSIEGLDEALVRSLASEGIRSFEELETAGLAVARRIGISYPRLLELQLHARRSRGPTLQPPAPSAQRTSPGVAGGAPPQRTPPGFARSPSDAASTPAAPDVAGPFV